MLRLSESTSFANPSDKRFDRSRRNIDLHSTSMPRKCNPSRTWRPFLLKPSMKKPVSKERSQNCGSDIRSLNARLQPARFGNEFDRWLQELETHSALTSVPAGHYRSSSQDASLPSEVLNSYENQTVSAVSSNTLEEYTSNMTNELSENSTGIISSGTNMQISTDKSTRCQPSPKIRSQNGTTELKPLARMYGSKGDCIE